MVASSRGGGGFCAGVGDEVLACWWCEVARGVVGGRSGRGKVSEDGEGGFAVELVDVRREIVVGVGRRGVFAAVSDEKYYDRGNYYGGYGAAYGYADDGRGLDGG